MKLEATDRPEEERLPQQPQPAPEGDGPPQQPDIPPEGDGPPQQPDTPQEEQDQPPEGELQPEEAEKQPLIYTAKFCPFCSKEFREGDRVQRCPACGLSYHQDCWFLNNGCALPDCAEHTYAEPDAVQEGAAEPVRRRTRLKPLLILAAIALCLCAAAAYRANRDQVDGQEAQAYLQRAKDFYTAVIVSGQEMEYIGKEMRSNWQIFLNDQGSGQFASVEEAISRAQEDQADNLAAVQRAKPDIDSAYRYLMDSPEPGNGRLRDIREDVELIYSAYNRMYNDITQPPSSYSDWASDFSSADSSVAVTCQELNDLLQ